MHFNYRSPHQLFTDPLKEYCEDKLSRPVARLKFDGDTVRFDIEASQLGENTGLRVLMHQPGLQITVSTLHKDAYGAVDLAVDKLSRKLRDLEDRKRDATRRAAELPGSLSGEPEDIFTADEEEVLKEMGALDAVLES